MSKYWWDAIGPNYNYAFMGHYNGNNYTISGIYTESGNTSTYSYQGLFGYVRGTSTNLAEIKYVSLTDSVIQGYQYVAGVVGYAYYANIFNCDNSATITATSNYVAGLIGFDVGTTVNENYNTGNISGVEYVGGIIGNHAGEGIQNCYNTGNIVGSSGYVGGIGGHIRILYGDFLEYCYNTGNILGTNYVGGVVGRLECGTSGVAMHNCYNIGEVKGVDSYTGTGIGGVVGNLVQYGWYAQYSFKITNCYNTGLVDGVSNGDIAYVGGVVGLTGTAVRIDIMNCFNVGEVKGNDVVGGIVGYMNDNASDTNCDMCYYGGDCDLNYGIGENYVGNSLNNGTTKIENLNSTEYAKNEEWYTTPSNWSDNYPYGWELIEPWDFESVWQIIKGINDGYPVLTELSVVTISFDANGGSGTMAPMTVQINSTTTLSANTFTRTGYNFTGWSTSASGSVEYANRDSITPTENMTLYAQWSRITYTIKYNKNASDATGSMANTTKYYGTNVTLRSNAFKRTGYSFAGWATSANGDVMYSNGATYTANANVTLYAKWDPHKYKIVFNGNGSTSGSMSNQTFTYGTAQKLTSNAFKKTGFTFSKWTRNADGTGTSYTNGQSVSNLTSSNGATINLYAQWTARNEAKYDSAGKYWYIENGKIPQTKVTNSTLISNLNKATTNGANYYIAGQTLTAKVYSGKEYCKWNNNWYEVEPIKWRLDASSSQKDGYGTTTDTNAVLAEIVYVDQYSSSSIDAGEGYSSQSVTDFMRNGISTTYLVNYATSTQTFGTGSTLYGTNASTTARMFVSSQSEITAVNGDLTITFSDLVEDMIKYYGGTNVYFTRDLGSNYNNIVCFNEVGREVQRFATDYRGVQFTVRFTEYACVG